MKVKASLLGAQHVKDTRCLPVAAAHSDHNLSTATQKDHNREHELIRIISAKQTLSKFLMHSGFEPSSFNLTSKNS